MGMDFALLPPEVNSGLIYAGPGSAPMLSNAASWDALAAELESTAAGYSSTVAQLTGQAWSGSSSELMTAAVTPYVEWLQASAAAAGQTAAQAYGAAAAYEAAYAMTVPPPLIAANRAQSMALIATNFLGQNTPAIAATEAEYMEMWVQDATAMYGYASASETTSTLTSFNQPPQTTNQNGQIDQARAVAQSIGNATSSRTESPMQLASTTTSQQLASPIAPQQLTTPAAPQQLTSARGHPTAHRARGHSTAHHARGHSTAQLCRRHTQIGRARGHSTAQLRRRHTQIGRARRHPTAQLRRRHPAGQRDRRAHRHHQRHNLYRSNPPEHHHQRRNRHRRIRH